MIYRALQTLTLACLALGLWQHDWTVIAASAALWVMWWLISEDVMEVA
jgi:hypothetical protein